MYELLGVAGLKLDTLGRSVISRRNSDRLSSLGSRPTTGTSPNCRVCATGLDVVFDSKQSYYSLFEEAGISWKKHRNVIPKDPELVKKKRDKRLQTG